MMDVGCRVIRGPDWEWSEQDNGEGGLGTIVHVKVDGTPPKALVQWDHSNNEPGIYGYRYINSHDLRLYDSGPSGVIHPHCTCDACLTKPVAGIRWKCCICDNFDLCTDCYMKNRHPEHVFMRILINGSLGERMPTRQDARQVTLSGILPGSMVKRGTDWQWKDQDGGTNSIGKVRVLLKYQSPNKKDKYRSFAIVTWQNGMTGSYRIGHMASIDVEMVQNTPDPPTVFIDHLPIIGGPIYFPTWQYTLRENCKIEDSDLVTVSKPVTQFRHLQTRRGFWTPAQEMLVGKIMKVTQANDDDVILTLDGYRHQVSKDAVVKADMFASGHRVKVMKAEPETLGQLQSEHGGVNVEMLKSMGDKVTVMYVDSDCDVMTVIDGDRAAWNRVCLRQVPNEEQGDDAQNFLAQLFLQALMNSRCNTPSRVEINEITGSDESDKEIEKIDEANVKEQDGEKSEEKPQEEEERGEIDFRDARRSEPDDEPPEPKEVN